MADPSGDQADRASAAAAAEPEEDEICRYCFSGREDGELVSPCKCSGGQKFVHLACLRRWQRMALVNQPTHPAFYERHTLHQKCGICQEEFSIPPPSRHELMESFTGAELAAMISEGCLLATDELVSQQLERQQQDIVRGREDMPMARRAAGTLAHWIRGVFLITEVRQDDGLERLHVPQGVVRLAFLRVLAAGGTLTVSGRRYRLVRWEDDQTTACLEPEDRQEPNCGDDLVVAVNLTRPLQEPLRPEVVEEALSEVRWSRPEAARAVEVSHYIGGPCDDDNIVGCLVPGGEHRGWSYVRRLQDALQLAHDRAESAPPAAGNLGGGQTVRLKRWPVQSELEGELGLLIDFSEEAKGPGSWLVQLSSGETVRAAPEDLEGLEGRHGRVLAFWGDARWSRVQLLGEIARGHWGLCRALPGDIITPHAERWRRLEGRLAFAPATEMTESYLEEARRQMTAYRVTGIADRAPEGE